MQSQSKAKNPHYFKDVSNLNTVDVYRVLELFNVVNPCVQHAVKKLLCSGVRNGGKTETQDIQEAIDSLNRFMEMKAEDNAGEETTTIDLRSIAKYPS